MSAPKIRWTRFNDAFARTKYENDTTWAQLIEMVRSGGVYKTKALCPWLKLAIFGDQRTERVNGKGGSYRHDANVVEVWGLEGDYDGEVVAPEQALAMLERAGIRAVIYTSPSHTPAKPRWRVLAILSCPHHPGARAALLARLNGALGGILSRESFTLSQSYYFGSVKGSPEYLVLPTFGDPDDGRCIDELDELDQIAAQPPKPNGKHTDISDIEPWRNADERALDWIGELLDGEDVHGNALRLVGQMVAQQMSDPVILAWFSEMRPTLESQRDGVRVAALFGGELQRMLDGARSKSFDHRPSPLPFSPVGTSGQPEWMRALIEWKPKPLAEIGRIEPVRFTVDPILPAGKAGVFVAAGGTGKTSLEIHLGCCIATGRAFLGFPVTEGAVLFLSLDDPQGDLDGALARTMDAMKLNVAERIKVSKRLVLVSLQDMGMPGFAEVNSKGNVTATGLADWLAQYARTIPELRLVVVDTLRQFAGGHSNDEEVMKISIAGITKISNATGATSLFSHHSGKQNYRDGIDDLYAGSGSAAIGDNARFVLVVQEADWKTISEAIHITGPTSGTPLKLTPARGALLYKKPEPFYYSRDEWTLTRVGGVAKTATERSAGLFRQAVASIDAGRASSEALRVALGKKQAEVKNLIAAWMLDGLLERESERKPLQVTHAGREFARGAVLAFSDPTQSGSDKGSGRIRQKDGLGCY